MYNPPIHYELLRLDADPALKLIAAAVFAAHTQPASELPPLPEPTPTRQRSIDTITQAACRT